MSTENNGLLFWIRPGLLIAVTIPTYLILQTETAAGPKELKKDKSQEKDIVRQVCEA